MFLGRAVVIGTALMLAGATVFSCSSSTHRDINYGTDRGADYLPQPVLDAGATDGDGGGDAETGTETAVEATPEVAGEAAPETAGAPDSASAEVTVDDAGGDAADALDNG